MRKADEEVLPDMNIADLPVEKIISLKQKKTKQLIALLFGEIEAKKAEVYFEGFRATKTSRKS